jgi:hypothetical protein
LSGVNVCLEKCDPWVDMARPHTSPLYPIVEKFVCPHVGSLLVSAANNVAAFEALSKPSLELSTPTLSHDDLAAVIAQTRAAEAGLTAAVRSQDILPDILQFRELLGTVPGYLEEVLVDANETISLLDKELIDLELPGSSISDYNMVHNHTGTEFRDCRYRLDSATFSSKVIAKNLHQDIQERMRKTAADISVFEELG